MNSSTSSNLFIAKTFHKQGLASLTQRLKKIVSMPEDSKDFQIQAIKKAAQKLLFFCENGCDDIDQMIKIFDGDLCYYTIQECSYYSDFADLESVGERAILLNGFPQIPISTRVSLLGKQNYDHEQVCAGVKACAHLLQDAELLDFALKAIAKDPAFVETVIQALDHLSKHNLLDRPHVQAVCEQPAYAMLVAESYTRAPDSAVNFQQMRELIESKGSPSPKKNTQNKIAPTADSVLASPPGLNHKIHSSATG